MVWYGPNGLQFVPRYLESALDLFAGVSTLLITAFLACSSLPQELNRELSQEALSQPLNNDQQGAEAGRESIVAWDPAAMWRVCCCPRGVPLFLAAVWAYHLIVDASFATCYSSMMVCFYVAHGMAVNSFYGVMECYVRLCMYHISKLQNTWQQPEQTENFRMQREAYFKCWKAFRTVRRHRMWSVSLGALVLFPAAVVVFKIIEIYAVFFADVQPVRVPDMHRYIMHVSHATVYACRLFFVLFKIVSVNNCADKLRPFIYIQLPPTSFHLVALADNFQLSFDVLFVRITSVWALFVTLSGSVVSAVAGQVMKSVFPTGKGHELMS